MRIDKKKLLSLILCRLQERLNVSLKSALEAKDAATNEESRSENKYDTRGLEASYLAGAQAKRVSELKEHIFTLEKVDIDKSYLAVEVGTIVEIDVDGDERRHYFILPTAAGEKVNISGVDCYVVTPTSPLGQILLAKKVGDDFVLKLNGKTHEYELLNFY